MPAELSYDAGERDDHAGGAPSGDDDVAYRQFQLPVVTVLGALFAWQGMSYTDWPAPATSSPHELHATGAAPILVVGTTYDPATPYPWAQSLAKQLDSATLLTRVGDGHTGYGKGSTCTDQAVDRYLLAGVVPAVGTVCR